mgnify:CR=1 FL=1
MRKWAVLALGVGVGFAFALGDADARPRSRTKVTVTKRSFLDAGTEVRPGERKFTDYVYSPNYRPSAVFDPTGASRFSLPRPWDLPGFPSGGAASF